VELLDRERLEQLVYLHGGPLVDSGSASDAVGAGAGVIRRDARRGAGHGIRATR
jgi:hypothetical protein